MPGSCRQSRIFVEKASFTTKKQAQDAESARRIEEQQKIEMAKAGAGITAAVPTTLGTLLQEFLAQHAQEKLAPKTVERYRESVTYLDASILEMPLADIKPLHLHRKWERLLKCGGHPRTKREPRPLAAKTVRNIAGVVSSAFGRAMRWGLIATNPVTHSEPPRVKKHVAIALTPAHLEIAMESASRPWCMRMFLVMADATGMRRGELLALLWADIVDGYAIVARSLSQTFREVDGPDGRKTRVHDVLEFKGTKTEKPRVVVLPQSALDALDVHRRQQSEFRRQFGPDYRSDLDLVFCNPDGMPIKPDSVSAAVSALFRRLKIPKPKGAALHLLRHSHTSILLAEGVPLPAVSARLGHSSVRTTQEIYAHMITGQDEEAARKWEEYRRRNRQVPAGAMKEQVQ